MHNSIRQNIIDSYDNEKGVPNNYEAGAQKNDGNPQTPEMDLILRIVSQWGNAVEMPNMEDWLKDYAAKRAQGAVWVKASERLPQAYEALFVKIDKTKSIASWNPHHEMFVDDAGDFHPADQVEWLDEAPVTNLLDILDEARLQIEYLHRKYGETESGNNILRRIAGW